MAAAARRTDGGFEVSKGFAAFLISGITLATFFVTLTAAGVRASDQLKATATKAEFQDSLKAVRATFDASIEHEARQDSAISWYGRQTLGLLCQKYHNPEAFCGRDVPTALQAGRPRTP